MTATCTHPERTHGVCDACGDCEHDVILNGACFYCGTTEIDPVAISPARLPRVEEPLVWGKVGVHKDRAPSRPVDQPAPKLRHSK